MNLMSTALSFLTPMITNKIASSLGINNSVATMAINAILPTILAALVGKSSTPSGAAALVSTLSQQDPNLLGSFASMLGGSGQSALVNSGASALSGLLGGSATSALAGAVGKFAGIDQTASNGLMGMLAPVLLGQLAQTQKSSGLDASGLAKMLEGQKGNIAAAMPAGFADLLKGTGLLDSVAGNLKTAAAPAAPSMAAPRKPSMPAGPAFDWMPWALGAVAVLGGLYLWSGSKPATVAVPAAPAAKVAAPAVPGVPNVAAAADALDQAKKLFSGLTSTLGGIKDEASAKAAVPQLTSSSSALDVLTTLTKTLDPSARAPIITMTEAAIPQLKPLIEAVLKIPGGEAMLKPVLEGIMAKMTGLSKV